MREDGLIHHIGLSNVSADQLRTALGITEIAAVTAHYNVGIRLGAGLLKVADEHGIVYSPWHPAAIPAGRPEHAHRAVLEPHATKYAATVHQVALAWQLHRSPRMLPIPGTTSVQHLEENLAAARITLQPDEVAAITALEPEDD